MGWVPPSERKTTTLPEGEGTILARRLAGSLVRQGTWKPKDAAAISWSEVLTGMDGPELRTRRRIADAAAKTPLFERVEEGRFLRYRLDRTGNTLRASPATGGLPPARARRRAAGGRVDAGAPSRAHGHGSLAAGPWRSPRAFGSG